MLVNGLRRGHLVARAVADDHQAHGPPAGARLPATSDRLEPTEQAGAGLGNALTCKPASSEQRSNSYWNQLQ